MARFERLLPEARQRELFRNADHLFRCGLRLNTGAVIEGEYASCGDEGVELWVDGQQNAVLVPMSTIVRALPPARGYYDYVSGRPTP